LPPWAKIQAPLVLLPGMELDPGETEAISLALENRSWSFASWSFALAQFAIWKRSCA